MLTFKHNGVAVKTVDNPAPISTYRRLIRRQLAEEIATGIAVPGLYTAEIGNVSFILARVR